jgi:hypothetical protein
MSADRTVVFYGIRFEITWEDVEKLDQDNGDRRIVAARKANLDIYYANFGGLAERFLLFIGKHLGSLGLEDNQERILTKEEFDAIISATDSKLAASEFDGTPKLYIEWQQDV